VDALKDIYQSVIGRTPGTPQYRDGLTTYIQAIEAWTAKAKVALSSTQSLDPSPVYRERWYVL
jgi:sialate O-acetylesterase